MEISKLIAMNVNTLRLERNLSLGQLSSLSEVSKVMISQIEKGDSNPSINVICKIANGLRVPYTALLEDNRTLSQVIGKDDLVLQTDVDGHFRIYTYYSTTEKRNFEFFRFELDSDYSYTSVGHTAKHIEYIMVIEGQLTITNDDIKYVLNENESVDLQTSNEHTYYASSNSMVKAICISHYSI